MAKLPDDSEMSCSFCGKRQPPVKLIAGPGIAICSECVARCMEIAPEAVADGAPENIATGLLRETKQPGGLFWLLFPKLRAKVRPVCNFCGTAGTSGADLVQPPSTLGRHALICGQCLRLCQDVIDEQLEAR